LTRRRKTGVFWAGLYAVVTNFSTFTIYHHGWIFGPCDLPAFKDNRTTAAQVALTPLTVTGDASVIAAIAGTCWVVWRAGAPLYIPQ
jgi:hypothetical protein